MPSCFALGHLFFIYFVPRGLYFSSLEDEFFDRFVARERRCYEMWLFPQ